MPPTEDFKLRKGLKLDASKMGTEGERMGDTLRMPMLISIGPLKIAYPATIEDAEQKVEEVYSQAIARSNAYLYSDDYS